MHASHCPKQDNQAYLSRNCLYMNWEEMPRSFNSDVDVPFTIPLTVPVIDNTVKCRYKAVQFIMILHTTLRKKVAQNASHISPHVWTMGCPLWGIWKNWPRYNRTALYFCMISPSLRTATILQVNMFVGFMIYVKWWYSYVLISAFMLIA